MTQRRPELIELCELPDCKEDGIVVLREGPLQGKRLCVEHLDEHGRYAGWWDHE